MISQSVWVDVAFWVLAIASVVSGWRVFRTDSMVRASFLLLASLLSVGAIMVLLAAEYLGFALIFMMALEMTVMALFMVAFMMNPAGLNPMNMVHQHRAAVAAGIVVFGGLAGVGVAADFPSRPVTGAETAVADLGFELLGGSMLIFESAGVTLLATMIGAVALANRRGRRGVADEGSLPPPLDPDTSERGDQPAPGPSDHGGHA
jgi:NADH-quinone oxidoreductase subunit J